MIFHICNFVRYFIVPKVEGSLTADTASIFRCTNHGWQKIVQNTTRQEEQGRGAHKNKKTSKNLPVFQKQKKPQVEMEPVKW